MAQQGGGKNHLGNVQRQSELSTPAEVTPSIDRSGSPAADKGWTVVTWSKRKQRLSPPQRATGRVSLGSEGGGAAACVSTPVALSKNRSASPPGGDNTPLDWRRVHPDKVETALVKLSPARRKAALLEMAKWEHRSIASRLIAQSPARGEAPTPLSTPAAN